MSHQYTTRDQRSSSLLKASFGARVAKVAGVTYQADEDGIVIAWGGSYSAVLYTSSDLQYPQATMIGTYHYTGGTGYAGISGPIKKGQYWQVSPSYTSVFWLPIIYT